MTRPALHLTGNDELPAPRVDTDSQTVLNEAIETLARLRTPYWLGDSTVHLHALASLIAQAEEQTHHAVRDARDQELTWTQIGQLLNQHPRTIARRYRADRR